MEFIRLMLGEENVGLYDGGCLGIIIWKISIAMFRWFLTERLSHEVAGGCLSSCKSLQDFGLCQPIVSVAAPWNLYERRMEWWDVVNVPCRFLFKKTKTRADWRAVTVISFLFCTFKMELQTCCCWWKGVGGKNHTLIYSLRTWGAKCDTWNENEKEMMWFIKQKRSELLLCRLSDITFRHFYDANTPALTSVN